MSSLVLGEVLVVFHPVRWKIYKTLKKDGPLYIGEIAKRIGEDQRLTSFHLSILEKYGFAKSTFKVIEEARSKGKAGRFYELTGKFENIRPEVIKALQI